MERLLDEGREAEAVPNLDDRHLPAASIIKRDLEYTAHHWREKNFDLWEEIEGTHCYTRLAQRRAMQDGARFAERLGDRGAAAFYREQARAIGADLGRFWNVSLGVLMPTLDRTCAPAHRPTGGIDSKYSHLDTSVILAILTRRRSERRRVADRSARTVDARGDRGSLPFPLRHPRQR